MGEGARVDRPFESLNCYDDYQANVDRISQLGEIHLQGFECVEGSAKTDTALEITTRDGTSPGLIRALRTGTFDFAVVTSRPPFRAFDEETPELVAHALHEDVLAIAVPASGRLAGRPEISAEEAASEP